MARWRVVVVVCAAVGLAALALPATAAAAAAEPTPVASAGGPDAEAFLAWAGASADAKCADYGFYEADQRKQCDERCNSGKTACVKKEQCGDGQCPPPGYCWKCGSAKANARRKGE